MQLLKSVFFLFSLELDYCMELGKQITGLYGMGLCHC